MTRDDVIQVGNRVRRDDWKNSSVTVTAVGAQSFLAVYDDADAEVVFPIQGTWRLEPQVAYVANVYGDRFGGGYVNRSSADSLTSAHRIGVLTVMTDGSATYEDTRSTR